MRGDPRSHSNPNLVSFKNICWFVIGWHTFMPKMGYILNIHFIHAKHHYQVWTALVNLYKFQTKHSGIKA